MLYYRRGQPYTPDYTQNIMIYVNHAGTEMLADNLLLSGNAFYRYLNTFVQNGVPGAPREIYAGIRIDFN